MEEEERNPLARMTDLNTPDPVKHVREEEAEALEEYQGNSGSTDSDESSVSDKVSKVAVEAMIEGTRKIAGSSNDEDEEE